MTTSITRDEASAAFYDGTARGELLLRQCLDCGTVAAPSVRQCPGCAGTGLTWIPAQGTATLISWTVLRDRAGDATAVAGLVELTEGPWMRSRLTGSFDPAELTTGTPLTVAFEPVDGAETVPVFRVTA